MSAFALARLIVGVTLLILGAELLVRGASKLAAMLGISPLIIGLTVVAFGTSAPELAVGLKAAFVDEADLAIGNAVGSNIFNILFVLGLAATIAPLTVSTRRSSTAPSTVALAPAVCTRTAGAAARTTTSPIIDSTLICRASPVTVTRPLTDEISIEPFTLRTSTSAPALFTESVTPRGTRSSSAAAGASAPCDAGSSPSFTAEREPPP